MELRSCATDRQCTRTECSSRQALLSGAHEVTACERVIGQDDSVNISCCVASAELTSSVLMILSTLNTMRTSEGHTEASWRRGFTWRFCRGCHVVPRGNGTENFQSFLSFLWAFALTAGGVVFCGRHTDEGCACAREYVYFLDVGHCFPDFATSNLTAGLQKSSRRALSGSERPKGPSTHREYTTRGLRGRRESGVRRLDRCYVCTVFAVCY